MQGHHVLLQELSKRCKAAAVANIGALRIFASFEHCVLGKRFEVSMGLHEHSTYARTVKMLYFTLSVQQLVLDTLCIAFIAS